jgi:hypothetical protein
MSSLFLTALFGALVKFPGCRYNTGEGKDLSALGRKHTTGDAPDEGIPQLDGIIAPEIEDDEPEQVREISMTAWVAAGEEVIASDVQGGDAEEEEEEVVVVDEVEVENSDEEESLDEQ